MVSENKNFSFCLRISLICITKMYIINYEINKTNKYENDFVSSVMIDKLTYLISYKRYVLLQILSN